MKTCMRSLKSIRPLRKSRRKVSVQQKKDGKNALWLWGMLVYDSKRRVVKLRGNKCLRVLQADEQRGEFSDVLEIAILDLSDKNTNFCYHYNTTHAQKLGTEMKRVMEKSYTCGLGEVKLYCKVVITSF